MKTTITIDWTLVLAAYGAVTATVAIAWDWWKWKHAGPDLLVTAQANMRSYGIEELEGQTVMLLNVTNRGDRATTITHFTMHQYPSWLSWIRKRAPFNAVINIPHHMRPPPHVLAPGEMASWPAVQNDEAVQLGTTGRLYLSVTASHNRKPIYVRVYPRP